MPKEIPRVIQGEEKIVRGAFHPFHVSKNKIKREAFIPPKGKNDVSTMRLSHSSPDQCKAHLKKLETPQKKFQGLAVFKAEHIQAVDKERMGKTAVEIKATPLDEQNRIRDDNETIYDTDGGNPFHSDILYSQNLTDEEEPKTEIRMLAEAIKKKVKYYVDTTNSLEWKGDALQPGD